MLTTSLTILPPCLHMFNVMCRKHPRFNDTRRNIYAGVYNLEKIVTYTCKLTCTAKLSRMRNVARHPKRGGASIRMICSLVSMFCARCALVHKMECQHIAALFISIFLLGPCKLTSAKSFTKAVPFRSWKAPSGQSTLPLHDV